MRDTSIACTVGILTYNSANSLERCLRSLSGFGEILIADGGSSDETLQIAERFGCTIMQQSRVGMPIQDFALERNRMLLAARYDWFFYLDSDEYLSPELREEIREAVVRGNGPLVYRVPWKIVSEDLATTYQSFKTYYQHRFFNRESGARFERKMHERITFPRHVSVGTFTGCWYVPLDVQLNFSVYKSKVDHRIRVLVNTNPPRNFLQYLKRCSVDPARNIAKQAIKFGYLRIRYSWSQLTPVRYELFKLYSQVVYVREATRAYSRVLRANCKTVLYALSYIANLFQRLISRQPEVLVLMYHAINTSGDKLAVPPDEFERQIQYLSRNKKVVRLDQVVGYLDGVGDLPDGAVAITFDDGYRDLCSTVLPILERYRVPVTVFIPSVESATTDRGGTPRLLWDEARLLMRSGVVTFESHGRTHRALPGLSEGDKTEEVVGSKEEIFRELGRAPRYFAYPYGARDHASERVVEEAGYDAAFGITEGLIRRDAARFALPRVQIDGTMSSLQFKFRLTGALGVSRRVVDVLRAFI